LYVYRQNLCAVSSQQTQYVGDNHTKRGNAMSSQPITYFRRAHLVSAQAIRSTPLIPRVFFQNSVSAVPPLARLPYRSDTRPLYALSTPIHTLTLSALTTSRTASQLKPRLEVMRLHGNFEGGDVVAAPKFTNAASDKKDPETGVVIRTKADAEKLGLGKQTQKPVYFIGYGYRNHDKVLEEFAAKLNVILIAIPLSEPAFFHADTCIASYPDSIAIYASTLQPVTVELLKHLYGSRIIELNEKQAHGFGANGRLLRDKKDPSKFYYFYTEGALDAEYITQVAKKCDAKVQTDKITLRSGDAFIEHRLRYTYQDRQQILSFVPMPTSQVLLGGGSVSCITQVTPEGIVMVPPKHFKLSVGQNPMETSNMGKLNSELAMREYVLQKGRLEAFGFKIIEMHPQEKFSEAVYTRDAGHTLIRQGGIAYDPAAFGPLEPDGQTIFIKGCFAHGLRQGEELEMLRALKNYYRTVSQ